MNTALSVLRNYRCLDSYKDPYYYRNRTYDAGFNDAIDGIYNLLSEYDVTLKKKKKKITYAG